MTNSQIIVTEALSSGLFTEEEVQKYAEKGMEIPLHSFAKWKALGFRVKKGEHARIVTRLWKFKDKSKESDESDTANMDVDGEGNDSYYKAKTYLFTLEQVELASLEKA